MKARFVFKGGKGSGNFGHSGRPGKRGGSGPGGGPGGKGSKQTNNNTLAGIALMDAPEITSNGDGTHTVGLYLAGEGHSIDKLKDAVEEAMNKFSSASPEYGYSVELSDDPFEVDGTTSVTAYVEEF